MCSTIKFEEVLKLRQKFLTIISGYAISSTTPEDILQDFYLKILRTSDRDGLSYLERYDGSTTYATFLYKPLKNLCYTIKTRENSEAGLALINAKKIEEAAPKEDEFQESVVYLENFMTSQPSIEDELLATQLMDIARESYSKFSSRSEKGIPRSVFVTVQLLFNGMTKAEIARALNVSSTFVDSQLKTFQSDVRILRLKKEYISI